MRYCCQLKFKYKHIWSDFLLEIEHNLCCFHFFCCPCAPANRKECLFLENPLESMNEKCEGHAINGNTWHLLQRFRTAPHTHKKSEAIRDVELASHCKKKSQKVFDHFSSNFVPFMPNTLRMVGWQIHTQKNHSIDFSTLLLPLPLHCSTHSKKKPWTNVVCLVLHII